MSGAAESALLLVWLCLLAAWDIRHGELPAVLLAAGGTAGLLLRIADLAAERHFRRLPPRICPALRPEDCFLPLPGSAGRRSVTETGYVFAFWLSGSPGRSFTPCCSRRSSSARCRGWPPD